MVITAEGKVLLGFVRATADGVTVRTTDGRFFDLNKDQIAKVVRMKVSLMPEQLAKSMTAQGLADLLAYVYDLPDLPALNHMGLSATVADAADEVLAAALWKTKKPGGRGAMRELIERLMQAKGCWSHSLPNEPAV